MESRENVFERLINDELFDELNNMVRWNGLNRNKDETVAHHSYLVTLFARVLADYAFKKDDTANKLAMTTYAVFHDFDEIFTGDVKHGVKYNDFNGEQLRHNLNELVEHNINMFFASDSKFDILFRDSIMHIPKKVKDLVKVCDWLTMGFYLKKEIELGSRRVMFKYLNCIEKLKAHCSYCIKNHCDMDNGGNPELLAILNDIININWKYDGVDD